MKRSRFRSEIIANNTFNLAWRYFKINRNMKGSVPEPKFINTDRIPKLRKSVISDQDTVSDPDSSKNYT